MPSRHQVEPSGLYLQPWVISSRRRLSGGGRSDINRSKFSHTAQFPACTGGLGAALVCRCSKVLLYLLVYTFAYWRLTLMISEIGRSSAINGFAITHIFTFICGSYKWRSYASGKIFLRFRFVEHTSWYMCLCANHSWMAWMQQIRMIQNYFSIGSYTSFWSGYQRTKWVHRQIPCPI